jgi:dCMP deaminase
MISWDMYFMSLVAMIARRSKDDSTKQGAVIVSKDHSILSTGYNSFPAGIDDTSKYRQLRPEKYYWFSHAEVNSIANSSKNGISIKDSTMYTNGIPCSTCAALVINAGISEVVYYNKWVNMNPEKWDEEAKRSLEMFEESGVLVRAYQASIIRDNYFYHRGEKL